jgi:hypothetical protein
MKDSVSSCAVCSGVTFLMSAPFQGNDELHVGGIFRNFVREVGVERAERVDHASARIFADNDHFGFLRCEKGTIPHRMPSQGHTVGSC